MFINKLRFSSIAKVDHIENYKYKVSILVTPSQQYIAKALSPAHKIEGWPQDNPDEAVNSLLDVLLNLGLVPPLTNDYSPIDLQLRHRNYIFEMNRSMGPRWTLTMGEQEFVGKNMAEIMRQLSKAELINDFYMLGSTIYFKGAIIDNWTRCSIEKNGSGEPYIVIET